MTGRDRTRAMIRHFGREMSSGTAPEVGFEGCMRSLGLEARRAPPPVTVWWRSEEDEMANRPARPFSLRPDHWVVGVEGLPGFYGYSNGPTHWTDRGRAKDAWEWSLLARFSGARVFGVDADYLVDEAWWPEVGSRLAGFLLSGKPWWAFLR